MKMYLGSYMDIYCLIGWLFLTLASGVMFILALVAETSFSTIVMAVWGFVGIGVSIRSLIVQFDHILVWGTFDDKGVTVKIIFQKPYYIEYSKCKDVGVGFYIQALHHTGVGNRVRYIYLSYDVVKKKYRPRINLVKNKEGFVKFKRSSKAYQYLINTLPTKQKTMLYYSNENDKSMDNVSVRIR